MSTLGGWAGGPRDSTPDEPHLERMLAAAWHDNGSETSVNCSELCALGVVRGTKPATLYQDTELQVAAVGNIYWKDQELRHLAHDQGDARAIARAYQRDDDGFLQALGGSFALALVDLRTGRTQLAIDPLGIERLCCTVADGQIVFCTSLQGLKAHPSVRSSISPQAIFSYFYFHMIPAPQTIYRDMIKLQPGETAIFSNGHLLRTSYCRLRYLDTCNESMHQLVNEFHHLLAESVARPQRQFERLGAFLSGGTDSSSVTAALSRIDSTPAKTFSIGFDAEGYDESHYARITADRFGTEHHQYYVTAQDVCSAIPQIAHYYDEPFGNASAVPAYFCAKLAREAGVHNLLAGDGGDEIFAGNERYLKQKIFDYWQQLPRLLRSGLIEPLAEHFPFGARIAPVRKLRSYIAQANIALPDRLESYNFLRRDPLFDIFCAEFLREIDTDAPLAAQRAVYTEAGSSASLNRMLYLDMKFTLADNDLRKVNGMCELAGVNAHYPLLDLDMVNFAAKVPVNLKIKGHKLRYFFKHALRDTLAPETLAKSKHGFGLPFGLWLKTHPGLSRLANDSLDGFRNRGYLKPDYIDRLRANHASGHSAYYGVMIWTIMTLECWLKAHD